MENKPTKLTLQHYNTMSWEGPWDASADDILTGLVGCMVGCGYSPNYIYDVIRDWLDERVSLTQTNFQKKIQKSR